MYVFGNIRLVVRKITLLYKLCSNSSMFREFENLPDIPLTTTGKVILIHTYRGAKILCFYSAILSIFIIQKFACVLFPIIELRSIKSFIERKH